MFDKFHVIKNAHEAVDKVRRAEVRSGGPGVWEALHKSQWIWRKNPENLTEQEQARLAGIQDKNLCTAKAYQMRLVLQDIYRSADATTARHRFKVWCRWVRWVARFHKASLLVSMVKLAQMVGKHLAGIVAHWKWGMRLLRIDGQGIGRTMNHRAHERNICQDTCQSPPPIRRDVQARSRPELAE